MNCVLGLEHEQGVVKVDPLYSQMSNLSGENSVSIHTKQLKIQYSWYVSDLYTAGI